MTNQNQRRPEQCNAPEIAYRRPDVYHSSYHTGPVEDTSLPYKDYKFLGRMAVLADDDQNAAKARAKERFGKHAKVFRTARWWVAYVVQ